MLSIILKSVIVASVFAQRNDNQLKRIQTNHKAQQLSNSDLRYISGLSNVRYTNEVLNNILIPRVVGTPNHKKVFDYITTELRQLDWSIEIDEFEDRTPRFGNLKFKNIIATLNPNADRYLVLACHYDSKYFDDEVFVGATDSAVPCAMMLNLAKVMKADLKTMKANTDLNLKLIFFDGEEAFVNWGPEDSIYGARHLAKRYHNNQHRSISTNELVTDIDKIDMLVLLDIIGHRGTQFSSCFQDTRHWHFRLAKAEDKLSDLGLLKKPRNRRYFLKREFQGYIEDDHIPFLERNVPILHLISNPFPREWHTSDDNRDIIDMTTVEDINKILRVFVAEYLNIVLPEATEENIPEKEL